MLCSLNYGNVSFRMKIFQNLPDKTFTPFHYVCEVNRLPMTLEEAIRTRHSVRQYLEKPIEAEKIQQLQDLINECNRKGGLHIQLVTNEPKAFASGTTVFCLKIFLLVANC